MIIYKATNLVNGKVYIGQTTRTLEIRKSQHLGNARCGVDTHFYNAIRKYGEENFIFEQIDTATSKDELDFLECQYILKYDSVRNGYNMSYGGEINPMLSDKVRAKHKARLQTQETRDNISKGMKKYRAEHPFTAEHRARLSASAIGNHNFGNTDTRSIGCYCILESGEQLDFHSYRDAFNWWKTVNNPFDVCTECTCQRKIKQSIKTGVFTYKHKVFEYPKWYKRKEGDVNEKVSNS